jgi:lysozyme family protein
MPKLTDALRAEYQTLFDTCQIRPERQAEINATAEKIIGTEARYRGVGDPLGVPWYVIGVIHSLDASLSFERHLHNGDPLIARTVEVPKGRPAAGQPPFTWEQSANDALAFDKYTTWTDWSVPGILFKWESYNGWGYRGYHPDVKTPYLWSYTNHYKSGKYVGDGTWSQTTVSKQAGAAAILRRLAERGAVSAPSFNNDEKLAAALQKSGGVLRYKPNTVTPGGIELQQFLNRFPGIFLREDGKLGPNSSAAYRQVFGHYLAGDPRAA